MEDWAVELQQGRTEPGWDLFISRYRRLIFASIKHYARDYDDEMDVFTRVCEALRENDCRKLRTWIDQPAHTARFSTWLVTVVRHITVDWFRQRDGRRRLSAAAQALPALQQRIFECVFEGGCSHREAYELIRSREAPDLGFRQFRQELRSAYQSLSKSRAGVVLRDSFGGTADQAAVDAEDERELPDESTREQVEQALAALEPAARVAVQLYLLEDLPAAQVARIAGLPSAKAVYNHVYRALAVMRLHLERAGVDRGHS